MGFIPINLLGVEAAGDFPVFPPGDYVLKVTKVDQKTSKSSGEPVLQITYEICEGPDGGVQFRGKTFPRSYSLGVKSAGFLKRLVLACGVTEQELASAGGNLTEERLVNSVIRAKISKGEYNGKATMDLSNEAPFTGAAQAAPAPSFLGAPPVAAAPVGYPPVGMPGGYTPPGTAVGYPPPPVAPPQWQPTAAPPAPGTWAPPVAPPMPGAYAPPAPGGWQPPAPPAPPMPPTGGGTEVKK